MRIKAFAFALLLLAPAPALAGVCLNVTVTPSALVFGNYTPSSDRTINTGVSIGCFLGIGILPDFDIGLTSQNSADMNGRYLKNGGARLNYNIYTTNGYATVWGDSAPNTQHYNSLLLLGSANFTGYGRIPAGQYVASGGPYTDVVTVTVTY